MLLRKMMVIFLIEIAVAGFSKDDIDLTLEEGVLTVTGNKKTGQIRENTHIVESLQEGLREHLL